RAVNPQYGCRNDVVRSGQQSAVAPHGDDQVGVFRVKNCLRSVQYPALCSDFVQGLFYTFDRPNMRRVRTLPTSHGWVSTIEQLPNPGLLPFFQESSVSAPFGDNDYLGACRPLANQTITHRASQRKP